MTGYSKKIANLIENFPIKINADVEIAGKFPTSANSEFLINKEQGDWAERLVKKTISEATDEYVAVSYGCSESLSSGDEGFADFFESYIQELNSIGKRPDILIFRAKDIDGDVTQEKLQDAYFVSKAVAAIEVRSSSFLLSKYNNYMLKRGKAAIDKCRCLLEMILKEPYKELLSAKNPIIYNLLANASVNQFKEIDFRAVSWSSSKELRELTHLLKQLKEQIKILHKRDYLSITPKLEDIALVNRWIQLFNVPHFYLQVFFDSAYIIPFEKYFR